MVARSRGALLLAGVLFCCTVYVRYDYQHGQPLDVFGKPGSRATTHIPLDFEGPIPGWLK